MNPTPSDHPHLLKCSLCGHEFREDEAGTACKGCALTKGCKLIKCPNCGYEWPPEPKWLRNLQKRRKNDEPKR